MTSSSKHLGSKTKEYIKTAIIVLISMIILIILFILAGYLISFG